MTPTCVRTIVAGALTFVAAAGWPHLSQNEIDAAQTVAFTDQLERSKGLPAASLASTRRAALQQLGTTRAGAAAGSSDQAKVRILVSAVNDLAAAQR